MKEFRDFVGYSFKYFIIVISITILLFALEAPVGSIIGIVLVMLLFLYTTYLMNGRNARKQKGRILRRVLIMARIGIDRIVQGILTILTLVVEIVAVGMVVVTDLHCNY
ncbi:MAG: hypothetical protein FWC91_03525 [Defluviitaleaceae bacterium]|nr:hypothetical protein [Defluviitaleaceae bacterium]